MKKKRDRAEGLKIFVTVVSTFEMLLLNTNPDHTFSVRQYGAAVPLHDSNLNHSHTVRLWGLRNSNKPGAMEMQHTTFHCICILADNNIKKTALLIKYYLTFSQRCLRKSTEKDKISCKKYISHEQTALGYHPSQTSVPTIHATASWWMKLKKKVITIKKLWNSSQRTDSSLMISFAYCYLCQPAFLFKNKTGKIKTTKMHLLRFSKSELLFPSKA